MSGTCTIVDTPFGAVTHVQTDKIECDVPHRLVILMDVSGSMGGEWLKHEKEALCKLLDLVVVTDVVVAAFDSLVEVCDISTSDKKKFINELRARGCTNFELALKKAGTYINPQWRNTILLTTDGEETLGSSAGALPELKSLVEQCDFEVTFHLLAFTRNSDIKLLTNLAKIGNKTGTLQYIRYAHDVSSAVIKLVEVIEYQSSVVTCDAVKVENNIIMSEISPESKICRNGVPIAVNLTKAELEVLNADVFTNVATGLTQWVSKQAATCEAQVIRDYCNQLRQMFKCGPREWRYSAQYTEIQVHITELLKMVSAPHNPDTTALLAAAGYGVVFTNHRFERRNCATVIDNSSFVRDLLCKRPSFRPLTTAVLDTIRCVINNTTVIEEHDNGGVMCITFLHETSEACIVAPHLLKIKEVFPIWMSFGAFEQSIQHCENHSDGFVAGLQGIRITGVLPINFDDHQEEDLASKYRKLAAGAAVAGNMAAFTELQVKTLPALVWMCNYLAPPTSWRKELDPFLRSTCKPHIDPVRATNFIGTSYKRRLPDWEPSLEVFVSCLILAEIDLMQFVFPVFEEYVRRYESKNRAYTNYFTLSETSAVCTNLRMQVINCLEAWSQGKLYTYTNTLQTCNNPSLYLKLNHGIVHGRMNQILSNWSVSRVKALFDKQNVQINQLTEPKQILYFLDCAQESTNDRREVPVHDYLCEPEVELHYTKKEAEANDKSYKTLAWQVKRENMKKYWTLYRDEPDIQTSAAIITALDEWELGQFRKLLRQPEAFNCPHYGIKLGLIDRSFMIYNSDNELVETWVMPQPLKVY